MDKTFEQQLHDAATVKEIAVVLRANGMRCNCDLDNWEPEASSSHSHVCRIHKAAWKLIDFHPDNRLAAIKRAATSEYTSPLSPVGEAGIL